MAPIVLVGAVAHAPASTPAHTPHTHRHKHSHALSGSRLLWATVDMCNPKNQPNTIGIRGSMPPDGRAKDVMYMRFRVQYFDVTTKRWVDLSQNGDSGFLRVGSADVARQAGRSFQLAPNTSKLVFKLRGTVVFQWRRGKRDVLTLTRPTTAGHRSSAGSDPRGFSVATCKLA